MDTTESCQKHKRKVISPVPVIGVIMILAGTLVLFLGADGPFARENHMDQSIIIPITTAEAEPILQDEKYESERELMRQSGAAWISGISGEIQAEPLVVADQPHPPELVSLGEYKITFYCKCEKCCGKSDGITATGTIATSNRTIAVDPKVIPYGSKVIIDGREYIAEDTGGFKGQTIDMFVDSHQEALNRGVIRQEVFVLKEMKP